MRSRKVATALPCRRGPACVYRAIRDGWQAGAGKQSGLAGMLTLGRELMGADKQAKSALERNSAVAKIKQDLAWRSATGDPMRQIVITRSQAEELVAEFGRLSSQGGKE